MKKIIMIIIITIVIVKASLCMLAGLKIINIEKQRIEATIDLVE